MRTSPLLKLGSSWGAAALQAASWAGLARSMEAPAANALTSARVVQLEWLSLCAMERNGRHVFVFGMDGIPDTWQNLRSLRALELRCAGWGGSGGSVGGWGARARQDGAQLLPI